VLPDLLFFSPNLRLGSFADLFEEKKTVPTDLQHILEIQRGRALFPFAFSGKQTQLARRRKQRLFLSPTRTMAGMV